MIRHAWPSVIGSGGIIGVVVFFALSGYLITGMLVRDVEQFGKIDYRRFYRNRALRLIPALLLFVAGLVVVTLVFDPLGDRAGLLRAVVIALTYTGDVPINHGSVAIGHLWSVAVEEQFYLVWPVVLVVGLRAKRLGLVFIVCAALVMAALIGTLLIERNDVAHVYALPTSWAIAMIIGAAARVWQQEIGGFLSLLKIRKSRLAGISLVVILALVFVPGSKTSPLGYLVMVPGVAVLTTVLIFSVREWAELPSRLLKPLVWLGTISYATYLWNYAIVTWMGAEGGAITIVLSIAAATGSWFLLERPVHIWREKWDASHSRKGLVLT
jgi:peptidoglycan/LPS O-acetylase OafA/YrhL